MKARIVITDDGKISLYVDEGTLEEGKRKIERLLSDMTAEDIKFEKIGAVEQHRHEHNREEVRHAEKE
jgi:hypothetical protein